MIKGMHGMFYTSQPEALRAFIRDTLRFPFVDVGDGWLIFKLDEVDLGCHPTDDGDPHEPPSGTHSLSFFCDDIHATVADLKSRGVEFTEPVADHGYGFVTHFRMPGDVVVQLYQPKYQRP
jgi:predicted enzyme related to lactoylglutathione lyase